MTTLTAPLPFTPPQVGGLTLGQRLDRAWDELHAQAAADCPVCDGRLTLAGDVARCAGCGSELR